MLRGPSGELLGLELDADYTGARYFVPDETQPELSMLTAGQMANDLAVGPPPSADAAPSAAADTAGATTAEADEHVAREEPRVDEALRERAR